jgi:hypothetical protein
MEPVKSPPEDERVQAERNEGTRPPEHTQRNDKERNHSKDPHDDAHGLWFGSLI